MIFPYNCTFVYMHDTSAPAPALGPLIPAREQLYKQCSADIQSLGLHFRYTEVGVVVDHWNLGSDYYPIVHT